MIDLRQRDRHVGCGHRHDELPITTLRKAEPGGLGSSLSGGRPIEPEVRSSMEELLSAPFGDVRIHTDRSAGKTANDLDADAYTIGENIVFASNQYRPGSTRGHALLAHELSHVLQHRHRAPDSTSTEMSRPGDPWEASATGDIVDRSIAGAGSPPRLLRQPAGHARGGAGEQQMAAGSYRAENGWLLVEGPSGAGGHGTTQVGFDGVAYNVRTGELHILDNKSLARSGAVGSATALDANLLRNLNDLITKVEGMSRRGFPYRQQILRHLRQARAAVRNGTPLPGRVRLIVTNAGGRSTTVSGRLKRAGVEFVDLQKAAPTAGTSAADQGLRAGHPDAPRPGAKRPAFGRSDVSAEKPAKGVSGQARKAEFTPTEKPIYPRSGGSQSAIRGRGRSRFSPKGANLADLVPSAVNVLQDISIRHGVATQMLGQWTKLERWRTDHPTHVIVAVVALQEWERPDPTGQVARSILYVHFYHGATADGALAQWDNTVVPAPPKGFQLVGPFIATIAPDQDLDEIKEKVEEQEACFIATVCFGTPAAEYVLTLRTFRDQVLKSNAAGRLLVRNYYRAAPVVAGLLAQHESARFLTRVLLVAPAARLARRILELRADARDPDDRLRNPDHGVAR
jgi:hypothetical protein